MFTASWTDYRQQRRIRELGSELSTLSSSVYQQRSEANRLRSQLAELQGSLDERLAKLSRAFDAFVELSDVRAMLALFDAPALVRHRTRRFLAAVGQPADAPAAFPLPREQDVAGYWLSPAARALSGMLAGTDPAADIAAAQALDAERTALLIAATATLAGRNDVAVDWLSAALGQFEPGVQIDAARRLLWREAANGSFGPAGVAEIEARLLACRAGTGEALLAALKVTAVGISSPGNSEDAIAAARQLSALRTLCTGPGPSGAAPRYDGATPRYDGAASRYGSAAPKPGGAAAEVASGPAALGELVRQLVDEGTEEEGPFLRRAEELRAIIEDRSVHDSAPRFDAPAGTPEKLMIEDAASATGGAVGELARRVLADGILAAAASLGTLSIVDPPTEATAELRTGAVRITVAGPREADVKKAREKAEDGYPPIVVLDAPTWILGVAGLVALAGIFLLPTSGAVLGVLVGAGLLIGGLVRLVRRRGQRVGQAGLRERAGRDVVRRADQAWKELLSSIETLKRTGEGAAADNEAIQQALKH
jgi:hypothetical protein